MAQIPGAPKLESRDCLETVPVGVPGLWEFITPDSRIRLRRGLNQSCSPRRDLSNTVSHSVGILLMAIGGYSIVSHGWLFYWWLLMVILLMVIVL